MDIIISAHGANGSRFYSVYQGAGNQIFKGNLKELTNFMVRNYPEQSEMLALSADPRNLPASFHFGSIEPSEQFKLLESLSSFMSKR